MEDLFLRYTSTYGVFREIPSKTKITGTEHGKFYRASPTSTIETLTTKRRQTTLKTFSEFYQSLDFSPVGLRCINQDVNRSSDSCSKWNICIYHLKHSLALSIHRQRETEADHFQSYSTDWSGPSMFMALKANSMFERRWSIFSRVAESLKRATTSRERMRRMTTRMSWPVYW